MSSEAKITQEMEQPMTQENRGLHYEENLLWEKEHSEHPGVERHTEMTTDADIAEFTRTLAKVLR